MDDRKIGYCLNSFIKNKIDDSIACSVSDQKLLQIGLSYGDIQSCRQYFPNNKGIGLIKSSQSYSEKLETLKATLKRTHCGRNGSRNRPISIQTSFNISVGLKCLEKIKGKHQYRLKHQTSFTIKLNWSGTYETLHNVIRNHYKKPAKTKTYLDDYKGQSVETTFKDAASFTFAQRDKKIHCSDTYIIQKALANISLMFYWKKTRNYPHPVMMKILIWILHMFHPFGIVLSI